jgi:threonine/homoserine/homoserine lactone efflux protein
MTPDKIAVFYFIMIMCFSPGPNNILSTAHATKYGYKKSLPLLLGMIVGFTSLGCIFAVAADWLSAYKKVFDILVYVGAAYIFYLAWKIASTSPLNEEDVHEGKPLGFKAGVFLQLVNGKVWFHFLTLMTTVIKPLDLSLTEKLITNFVNSFFGMCAISTWALGGSLLRKMFSNPKQARVLNGALGLSLVVLGLWLIFS